MKKKCSKILIFILSVFSIIPISVHAIAITTVSLALAAAGILLTSAGLLANGITKVDTFENYDDRVSLFDGLENNIPVCEKEYENYCKKDTVPDIKKMVDDNPYIIRFTIKINSTGNEYYIFGFYNELHLNELYRDYDKGSLSTPTYTISMLPKYGIDESFDSAFPSSPQLLAPYSPNSEYSTLQYIRRNKTWRSHVLGDQWYYFYNYTNPNYTVSIDTNFDLDLDSIDYTLVKGPTFKTDMDITVKPGYYLRLFPKHTTSFSSYFITDNNFLYNYSTYDKDSNTILSSGQYGKLTQINFYALGGYNWFNWQFDFTDNDIASNKFLELYNSNNNVDLHIKFFSKDFYYYILDKNSNCTSINGMCIPNNYNDLYLLDNSLGQVENIYDSSDYDNGLSFIKSIPNMITDFVSSFAFIGTLFVSFFNIFTGVISNYFYIIFGLMIIMIIIKILK